MFDIFRVWTCPICGVEFTFDDIVDDQIEERAIKATGKPASACEPCTDKIYKERFPELQQVS